MIYFLPNTIAYVEFKFNFRLWESFIRKISLSLKHHSGLLHVVSCTFDNMFYLRFHSRLEELKIDDNLLINLPNTLKLLRNLKSLQVSNNRISKLPDFMVAMRFNNGLVSLLKNT